MSRKVNQVPNTPPEARVQEVREGIAVVEAVKRRTDETINAPTEIPGGASGAPPPASPMLTLANTLSAVPAPREIPPDQMPPPPRRFEVKNDETIPNVGIRGASVMINGSRVHLACGRIISEQTHDIERLRKQGVRFEEITQPTAEG